MGSTEPAGPRCTSSKSSTFSGASRLTRAVVAPERRACWAIPAAGCTCPEVPTTRQRSPRGGRQSTRRWSPSPLAFHQTTRCPAACARPLRNMNTRRSGVRQGPRPPSDPRSDRLLRNARSAVDRASKARPHSRTLVQVVHVLAHQQGRRPFGLQTGDGTVGSVRLDRQQGPTPKRVEPPHRLGIAEPCRRRGHVLNAMPFPQPVHIPEGRYARLR